jgi:hypothetical protein
MKFYIKDKPKTQFYLIGTITDKVFKENFAYKFISEYISDFPGLLNEIQIIDENDRELGLLEFFDLIVDLEKGKNV